MKNKVILLFILFLSANLFSQSGWVWQNPLPQGNTLNSVVAIDSNNAVAVGYCGTVIKTINRGINWSQVHFPDTISFNSIYFINKLTGWITGGTYAGSNSVNVIYKTSNGGLSWKLLESNLTGYQLYSIFFLNSMTGYVAGGNISNGKIIKTTNGGINWIDINAVSVSEIYSIYYINENTGWAGLNGKIGKTTNGGIDWNLIPVPYANYSSIKFLDSLNGFVCGGQCFRTTNGGANWTVLGNYGRSVYFADQKTGWMGGGTQIYKTTNAGNNWTSNMTAATVSLHSISFANSQIGWAVGDNGVIQHSGDGGITWSEQSTGFGTPLISDVSFINSTTGFVIGSTDTRGYLYKTTDGGNNWNYQFMHPTLFSTVCFVNENTGWIGGHNTLNEGKLLKTTDSGTNLELQVSLLGGEKISDIKFFNENTGFIFIPNVESSAARVFKTTNGGENWSGGQFIGSVNKSSFLDMNTGWVSCVEGKIYRTTDSGNSWDSIQTGLSSDLYSIKFVNYNTGWVGDINGYIYRTTNGGTYWETQCRITYSVTSIDFINSQTGWAVSSNGTVVYTSNMGTNWINYPRLTYSNISKIVFPSPTIGWIVGGNGIILKTTNGGGLVTLNINSNEEKPKSFMLSQNYPNPFNPTTNIKFDLPKSGFVKLTIYDALGREVAILVDQEMKVGSYNADWDATSYSSGMYFYKLETDDFAETRKMVLIK